MDIVTLGIVKKMPDTAAGRAEAAADRAEAAAEQVEGLIIKVENTGLIIGEREGD